MMVHKFLSCSSVFEQDTRIAPATSSHGSLDYIDVLKNLGLTILAPLVVGQIIQWLFPRQVAAVKDKCRLGDINSIALLALVWSVFSDAIASNSFASVGAVDVVAVVIINACFYISFSMFCLLCSRLPLPRMVKTPKWVKNLRYSREDTVAVMVGYVVKMSTCFPLVSILNFEKKKKSTVVQPRLLRWVYR
jgi:sodium/bile acid cotransporter 7